MNRSPTTPEIEPRTVPATAEGSHHPEAALGLACGIAAHVWWGLFPIYFKLLAGLSPITILAHRVGWSFVFLAAILTAQRRWRQLLTAARSRRTLGLLVGSTLAIGVNWYVFIWAVGHGQVLASSLGYFINPLVVVCLGVAVLGERMRPAQIVAVVLAVLAVAWFIWGEGHAPAVSLLLAFSFAIYGLLRKLAVVSPIIGLTVETTLLIPFALYFIGEQVHADQTPPATYALLTLAGPLTAMPLLWFAKAARRLRLSTLGFLQYITPTLQFALGRFAYHEPFSATKLASFVVIWVALIIFTIDSIRAYRRQRSADRQ